MAEQQKQPGSRRSVLLFSCAALAVLMLCAGCSVKRLAVGSLADALGSGAGAAFTGESDLELVNGALPFSLKAMESLLEKTPQHRGLHLSLAQGYMLYAYAFVDLKADEQKDRDFAEYQRLKDRARSLYYRAFAYARRGLELSSKEFEKAFAGNNPEALRLLTDRQEVPYLYWTGAALAKWIMLAKTDPAAAIRLPEAAACMQRALALDPDFDRGAIHEFFIAYEARGAAMGGAMTRAADHFHRACQLAEDKKISPLVTYAEACSIPAQNGREFDALMQQILGFDADRYPEYRLVNTIAKKRAAWLQQKKDDLFLGE